MGTSLYEQFQREQQPAQPASSSGGTAGLRVPGNIDVMHRPRVHNPDGSISTVRSISIGTPQGEVLIPTVSDDGRVLSDDDAVKLYQRTGKHLGIFADVPSANAYAQSLHQQQARMIASDPPSLYAQFLSEQGGDQPHESATAQRIHDEYRKGLLAGRMKRENENDADQAAAETPSYAEQALGGLASFAKDIPGGEAAQAGARSLVRGQSYRDALSDIQGAEASAPSAVRNLNRLVGGVAAAGAIPGSPALSGARYGILSALGSSNPDADAQARLHSALVQGAIGGAAGKATDVALSGVRSYFGPTLGKTSLTIKKAMTAADKANYGAAAAEGAAAGGTSPAIHAALSDPDVAPFAEVVRNSRTFRGADDATVLRETYKLMSERQGLLAKRVLNADDFKAGTSLEKSDVGLAKSGLLKAAESPSTKPPLTLDVPAETHIVNPRETLGSHEALTGPMMEGTAGRAMGNQSQIAVDASGRAISVSPRDVQGPAGPAFQLRAKPNIIKPGVEIQTPAMRVQTAPEETVDAVMPSLRKAVQEHAQLAKEYDAFTGASDAAKRVMGGGSVAGKRLATRSPEAFARAIGKMSPAEARAALAGVLGRTQEGVGLSPDIRSFFGVGRSLASPSRVAPFVRQLDQVANQGTFQHGFSVPDLLRALGVVDASGGNP